MKFSIKTLAAAVVMAAAATGAQADIVTGSVNPGNGELFFNIWDANGSYTRGLNVRIDSFQTELATTGNFFKTWASDSHLNTWLASADVSTLQWNVVANDTVGANRLLTTYTVPEMAVTKQNDVIRSAGAAVTAFLNNVNPEMPNVAGASVSVDSGSAAYAGKAAFNNSIGGLLNFSNAGTLANDTFASGLGFMRIDAASTGIAKSVYNEYYDPSNNTLASITNPVGGNVVKVYFDANNTLHIAAVPEPESYAMLLAGLGMIGFMARRRNKRA